MLRIVLTGLAAAALFVHPAVAQESPISPMDFSIQRQVMINTVVSNIAVGDVARKGRGNSRDIAAHGGSNAAKRFKAGGTLSDAPMPYATSPASQQAGLRAYIARIRSRDPKLAGEVERAFAGGDVHQRFVQTARTNGLNANDTADVMTAFLLAGYEIITGHEPTGAETRGVRRQVAGQLLDVAELRNPAARTEFSEELKIQFLVLASGYLNARSDSERAQYRKGVSEFYRRATGQDIGHLRLTATGFSS
jgi:hypothetical protein